jgi:hypothetical protein
MSSILQRFKPEITLEYSLIDRMRIRGHIMNMQSITLLRTYFQQVRAVNWIDPRSKSTRASIRAIVCQAVPSSGLSSGRVNRPSLRISLPSK